MKKVINQYQCPVCGFSQMDEPPKNHAICACCGTHFGYSDSTFSHRQLRDKWLASGGKWFDIEDSAYPKWGWDAWSQLDRAGFPYSVKRTVHTTTEEFPVKIPGAHSVEIPGVHIVGTQMTPEFRNLHA